MSLTEVLGSTPLRRGAIARWLGAEHVGVDPDRARYPVCGTAVRADPFAMWEFLHPVVRAWYVRRVCVVGAESTGTTTLARDLAEHFGCPWVPEYGRTFCEERLAAISGSGTAADTSGSETEHAPGTVGTDVALMAEIRWRSEDFVWIAGRQLADEDAAASRSGAKLIVCDTDALAASIWHERYLGTPAPEVDRLAASRRYDLYLLTGDEIPFVQDGTREGEHLRAWMTERFRQKLSTRPEPWIEVTGGSPVSVPAGPPPAAWGARPDRGTRTDREERIAGALLGVHAGDALGATCEFRSWAQIRASYPDGLRRYRATRDPRQGGAGLGSAGNGSLTRAVPTALAVPDRARRITESLAISAITHDDPRCTVACPAYNEIVAALIVGTAPADAVQAGLTCATELGQVQVADAIGFGRALRPAVLASTGNTSLDDDGSGYVLDSLALAVAAVLDPRPFPDVVVDIVRVGNDTDTNAAIAGGLLGARDGLAAIPADRLAVLQFRDEFLTAAQRLAAIALPGAGSPC
jgi:ADP-ribosylglycohydrolase/nicotinamide riboside kinase